MSNVPQQKLQSPSQGAMSALKKLRHIHIATSGSNLLWIAAAAYTIKRSHNRLNVIRCLKTEQVIPTDK